MGVPQTPNVQHLHPHQVVVVPAKLADRLERVAVLQEKPRPEKPAVPLPREFVVQKELANSVLTNVFHRRAWDREKQLMMSVAHFIQTGKQVSAMEIAVPHHQHLSIVVRERLRLLLPAVHLAGAATRFIRKEQLVKKPGQVLYNKLAV